MYTRPSVPCLSESERVHKGNLPSIYLLVYCTSVPYPCDSPPHGLAGWLADWHRPFTARPFVPLTPPVPPKAVISCSRTFGGTKHSKSATRGNVNPSAHTISLFYRSRKRLIISHGPFNSLTVHPGSPPLPSTSAGGAWVKATNPPRLRGSACFTVFFKSPSPLGLSTHFASWFVNVNGPFLWV